MSDELLIVTSVDSRVIEELADAVGRSVAGEVHVRTGMAAGVWAEARSRGAFASLSVRIRGFLFPLRVDLGPRRSDRTIIATTNPFLLPAVVALRRPRARLVTLVYDLYPESIEVRVRIPRLVGAVVAGVTAFGLRRSTAVVLLGERTRDHVVDRYSLTCPTAVIPPGCDSIPRASVPPPTLAQIAGALDGKVVVSYVGNMGTMHDGVTLAEALHRVLVSSGGRCALVISARGDRAAELVSPLVDQPEVTVLEHLDDAEWAWLIHRTDIALASLDARAALVSLPSKVFASIAGGAAILAVAPEGSDLADLIRTRDVGIVVPPGDVDAATQALEVLVEDEELRSRFGAAALAASADFSPAMLASRWASVLEHR